jgi:hypothetical protein
MDLRSETTPGATPMTPSLRIRRLCDRLRFLADVLDKVRGAPASPPAVDECIVQLEASTMLLDHELSGQPPATAMAARRYARRRVPLKFPSSPADSGDDTPRQEKSPCADASR